MVTVVAGLGDGSRVKLVVPVRVTRGGMAVVDYPGLSALTSRDRRSRIVVERARRGLGAGAGRRACAAQLLAGRAGDLQADSPRTASCSRSERSCASRSGSPYVAATPAATTSAPSSTRRSAGPPPERRAPALHQRTPYRGATETLPKGHRNPTETLPAATKLIRGKVLQMGWFGRGVLAGHLALGARSRSREPDRAACGVPLAALARLGGEKAGRPPGRRCRPRLLSQPRRHRRPSALRAPSTTDRPHTRRHPMVDLGDTHDHAPQAPTEPREASAATRCYITARQIASRPVLLAATTRPKVSAALPRMVAAQRFSRPPRTRGKPHEQA